MTTPDRPVVVVDTNAWISALLGEGSVPWQAVRRALSVGTVVVTADTLAEIADVLRRSKFDRYLSRTRRERALRELEQFVTIVPVRERLQVCRDPKDDKLLEAAVAGGAETLITGDRDLLALRRFRATEILSPAEYLARTGR